MYKIRLTPKIDPWGKSCLKKLNDLKKVTPINLDLGG